jgi:hypothetical protein
MSECNDARPDPEILFHTDLTVSENQQFDDTFSDQYRGGTGILTTRATARFYEGLKLPATFQIGNVNHAGDLPATYVDPHLPLTNATSPVIRAYTLKWPVK